MSGIHPLLFIAFSFFHHYMIILSVLVLVHVMNYWGKNTNKMQQYRWFIVNCRCWLLSTVSTCFGHLYAQCQEKRPCVTAYGVYLLVVLDVAGCGTVVLLKQQPSQCSHPQRSTTVPQPATSNTTSKYIPYAVTRGIFSWWWAYRCPKHVETVVNNQHLQLTINHLYCCILLVFFLHALLMMHGHRNIINYSFVFLCDRLKLLSPNLTVVKCPIVWFLKIGISMLRWLN